MYEKNTDRALVLGLDGVPWELIERWADAGELQNFNRLLRNGSAGPLESTIPASTPLAWPSIATGTWPDSHGIYAFRSLQGDYSRTMNTSSERAKPALWDLLGPVTIGNVPMTYPAESVDGEMVTGMITPEIGDGFTDPPSLQTEIERDIPNYQIALDWNEYAAAKGQFVDDLERLVSTRRQLMHRMLGKDEWQLGFFVYTAPDRLQHLIWDEEVLLDHYRTLDEIVGEAMTYATETDATLYVVSDHGFGPISTFVHLNSVLSTHGFLSPKAETGMRGSLASLGISKSTVHGILDTLGLSAEWLDRHLPRSLLNRAANRIPGSHGLYDVDFSQTSAFSYGPGLVYVNDTERFDEGVVSPTDRESVAREIYELLDVITNPDTGSKALDVYSGNQLFPSDPLRPDLVAVGRDDHEVKMGLPGSPFEPAGHKAAGHRSTGIFMSWGSRIAAGASPTEATVVDVAPTILHDLDAEIPAWMDGRVLEEIFATDSDPATRAPTIGAGLQTSDPSTDTADREDFEGVEDRLRGLGYLE